MGEKQGKYEFRDEEKLVFSLFLWLLKEYLFI